MQVVIVLLACGCSPIELSDGGTAPGELTLVAPARVALGDVTPLECNGGEALGDGLRYVWMASAGGIEGEGASVTWTAATEREDRVTLRCTAYQGDAVVGVAEASAWMIHRADELRLHYPFSGDTLDASDHGHDLDVPSPALAPDRFERGNAALGFDGRSAAQFPGEALDVESFSLGLFVAVDEVEAISSALSVQVPGGPTTFEILVARDGASGEFALYGAAEPDVGSVDPALLRTIELGGFVHLMATYVALPSTLEVYVDGALRWTMNTAQSPLREGALVQLGVGTRAGFIGRIDDIRLYEQPLRNNGEALVLADTPL